MTIRLYVYAATSITTRYCSPQCQTADWHVRHQYECGHQRRRDARRARAVGILDQSSQSSFFVKDRLCVANVCWPYARGAFSMLLRVTSPAEVLQHHNALPTVLIDIIVNLLFEYSLWPEAWLNFCACAIMYKRAQYKLVWLFLVGALRDGAVCSQPYDVLSLVLQYKWREMYTSGCIEKYN